MRLRALIPAAVVLAALAAPAAASADTLLAPAPQGSQNLTAAGGLTAWAQPNDPAGSGWRIVLRAADGTVSTPDIPVFEEVPDPSFGSAGRFGRDRVLIYSRAGDVFTYDLAAGRESLVAALSSSAIERTPTVVRGVYAFVRVNGKRAGVYRYAPRSGPKRISADIPRELAFNGSRVAYPRGNSVVIHRMSISDRPFVIPTTARPTSLIMVRYRATWLAGGEAFKTPRFGGSGPKTRITTADRAERALPAGTTSIAFERDRARLVLDAEGVKRLNPAPFGSRG